MAYVLIFLFLFGAITTTILNDFEAEPEYSWASSFASLTRGIIGFLGMPVILVGNLIEGLANIPIIGAIFSGAGPTEEGFVIVSGTGNHEEETLDGLYEFTARTMGTLYFTNVDDSSHQITFTSPDEYLKLKSTTYTPWWKFWGIDVVYTSENLTAIEYGETFEFYLEQTDLDFNDVAYGDMDLHPDLVDDDIKRLSIRTRDSVDRAGELVYDYTYALNHIPDKIGIPIMIIVSITLLLIIIKLLPFT